MAREDVPKYRTRTVPRLEQFLFELAIHIPKPLIPDWITGHTIARTIAAIAERRITTNGMKRLPLKNDKASGNLRKL